MNKVKIAVLVSGGGTNLKALIDAQKSGIIKSGEIKVVISNNKEAYALKRAEKNGIKSYAVSKKDNPNINIEDKILEILKSENIEMIILAGFMAILSKNFIKKYENRIINIHPSLIPSFCGKGFYGLKVHEAALEYGVKVTGATVHYVNEIPDAGRIIAQKAVEIEEDDTPKTLQLRVMKQAEHIILPKSAELVAEKILKEREKG